MKNIIKMIHTLKYSLQVSATIFLTCSLALAQQQVVDTTTTGNKENKSTPEKPLAPVKVNKSAYPEFSWDQVPLAMHFGRVHKTMTNEEVKYVAERVSMISFEKAHGLELHGSTEKGVAYEAQRLKSINPKLKVLMYWNILVKYDFFLAMKEIKPGWLLKNRAGYNLMKSNRRELFDIFNEDFQSWWSFKPKQMIKTNHCDGIFVDAIRQPFHWCLRSRYGDPSKTDDLNIRVSDTISKLLVDAKQQMGEDSLLIYNGISSTNNASAVGKKYLPYADGAMFDFFTIFHSKDPDAIVHDITAIQEAGRLGKITVVKAWPGSGLYFRDREAMKRPIESLIKEAKENIIFPLACYLVAAEQYSYFCYSWGFTERPDYPNLGSFVRYPEYDKPLGKPLALATKNGYLYTREFEHASVRVDVKSRKSSIKWKSESK